MPFEPGKKVLCLRDEWWDIYKVTKRDNSSIRMPRKGEVIMIDNVMQIEGRVLLNFEEYDLPDERLWFVAADNFRLIDEIPIESEALHELANSVCLS